MKSNAPPSPIGMIGCKALIAALLVALVPHAAVAQVTKNAQEDSQDMPDATDDSLVLDTINVTGRTGLNSKDAQYQNAGSSSYLSGDDIQRFRGTSPGDFLSGQPGILVGAKRTSGAVDVNIRGMQGMDRVPVTVDGAQQSNTVYRGYAGVASRSYIDPDFISDVVVEKGPSLATDGAGATGGVVRMRTIDADDILLDGHTMGIRLRAGMMSNTTSPPAYGTRGGIDESVMDRTYPPGTLPDSFAHDSGLDRPGLLDPTSGYGSVIFAARNEGFDVIAGYARRKMGNYFVGDRGGGAARPEFEQRPEGTFVSAGGLTHFQAGEEVLNTSNDSTSYLIKSVARLTDEHQLELGYTRYDSLYYEMFPSQVMWLGGPYQEIPSAVELDTYTATYTWKPEDNDLLDLKINIWNSDINFNIGQSAPTIFPDVPPMTWHNLVDAQRQGVNISNASQIDTAAGLIELRYGGSYTDETMQQVVKMNPLPPYFPEPILSPGKSGTRTEWSVFGAALWRPLDWLIFDAGVRYTESKTRDHCLYSSDDPCKDTSNDGFAPIISATVEPWRDIQFYARYAEAIRSASLYEATRGESFTVSPIFDLVPEHAKNWEFGANVLRDDVFVQGDSMRLKAAYFDNNIEDYLTRTTTMAGERGIFTLRNLNRARFKGVEFSANYDRDGYFAELGYTRYLKTTFCLTAEVAAGLDQNLCNEAGVIAGYAQLHVPPKQTATLQLGARAFKEKLALGARIGYVGARIANGIGDDSGRAGRGWTIQTPWESYVLTDVFATWQINKHFQAEFNVDNLTDVYYVDALAMGLVPAPGRTLRVGFSAKF